MKNRIIALLMGTVLLVSSLSANPYFEPVNPFKNTPHSRIDSLNVRFVGNWPFGRASAIEYDSLRQIIFSASGGGVYVFDVANPASPKKVSEKIHTRGYVNGLHFNCTSHLLYIVGENIGFEIWDASDYLNPQKLGQLMVSQNTYDVSVSDTLAYVVDEFAGLSIINVSEPLSPFQVGHDDSLYGHKIKVLYPKAYIARSFGTWNDGVKIINISDPNNINILGEFDSIGVTTDVEVKNSILYIANYDMDNYELNGLLVVSIANPSNPVFLGSYETLGKPIDVHIVDTVALLAESRAFSIIDISDSLNPHIVGYCDIPIIEIIGDNQTAFGTGNWEYQGINSFDITDPTNPQLIGQYKTPLHTRDVFIKGQFAYIADLHGFLRIIDISDPSHPYETGFVETINEAQGVFVVDTFAFVAVRDYYSFMGFLEVVNVSNSQNPVSVGLCPIQGSAYDVFVEDSFAYIGCGWPGETGFSIVNVSNPTNPYMVHFHQTYEAKDFDMIDSILYVAINDWMFGALFVYNVAIPTDPQMVGWNILPNGANGIDLVYPFGYIADVTGLMIVDIQNPFVNPPRIGWYPDGYLQDCHIVDDCAYLAQEGGYIKVVDIHDPSNPELVGYYETPSHAVAVATKNSYSYVANSYCGLQIYQFYGAGVEEEQEKPVPLLSSLQLLQNPASGDYFEVILTAPPQVSNTEITLYNQIGQMLKAYQFGGLKSGENKLRLDVTGLPAGVYFLKATVGDHTETKKLIKIR